jgi:heme oxygenase
MLPLKEATSAKHQQAERMPFNVRMFRGLLTKDQYALYLHQQLQIFSAIESVDVPHVSLKRTARVQEDINELKNQGHHSEMALDSTNAYADYLRSLSYQEILPHIYLNYLALVFGGQMIKKSVPSSGQMYAFDDLQEVIQSIRSVQKDTWADEVNKGFDFTIRIFEQLEVQCAN